MKQAVDREIIEALERAVNVYEHFDDKQMAGDYLHANCKRLLRKIRTTKPVANWKDGHID